MSVALIAGKWKQVVLSNLWFDVIKFALNASDKIAIGDKLVLRHVLKDFVVIE